ncbi:MAG: hypothetical protein AAFY42_13520 [Pseudomonadota bacterium]
MAEGEGEQPTEEHRAHVDAWALNFLRGLPAIWRENAKRAREEEWRDAVERGDATEERMRMGLTYGLRAPLSYFQRACEADEMWSIGMLCGGPPCPIGEALECGRMLDFRHDWKRLRAEGVPTRMFASLVAAGDLVKARCDISWSNNPRTFQFGGPDGRLVIAARDENFVRDDAVAFRLDEPGDFAVLTGGSAFLGEWLLRDLEVADGRRLALVSDPLEWLRRSGKALCVLDWQRALPRLRSLGEGVTLECDAGAGEQLRAKLKVGGLPRVQERAPQRRAA